MSPTGWVCEGPLDLGAGLWVSRALEAGKLLDLLRPEGACVFIWSPPKCGTTTFFAELCRLAAQQDRLAVRIVDARQELNRSAFEAPESAAPLLLVIDELEDLGRPDDVEKFLQQAVALAPPSARWVLAGDNRAWKRAREIERFRALEEFSLGPMLGEEIARRLVAAPLAEHERHLDLDAGKQLCEAGAGNWAKAVEFYKLELSLWKGTRWGKGEVLEEAVNACFAARTPLDFVSLARQLSHDLPPERRAASGNGLFVSGRQAYMLGGERALKHTDERSTIFQLRLPMACEEVAAHPAGTRR